MPVLNKINRMLSFPINDEDGKSWKCILDTNGNIYNFNDDGTISSIKKPFGNVREEYTRISRNGNYIACSNYNDRNQILYKNNVNSVSQMPDINQFLKNYNYTSKMNDGTTYLPYPNIYYYNLVFIHSSKYMVIPFILRYDDTSTSDQTMFYYKIVLCIVKINDGLYEMDHIIDTGITAFCGNNSNVYYDLHMTAADDLSYIFIDASYGALTSRLFMGIGNINNGYSFKQIYSCSAASTYNNPPKCRVLHNKYFIGYDYDSSSYEGNSPYYPVYRINDDRSITRLYRINYNDCNIIGLEYINDDYIITSSRKDWDIYDLLIGRIRNSIHDIHEEDKWGTNNNLYENGTILIDNYERKTYYIISNTDSISLYVKNNSYYLDNNNNLVQTGEAEVRTMIYNDTDKNLYSVQYYVCGNYDKYDWIQKVQ